MPAFLVTGNQAAFEAQMIKAGAIALDGTAPTAAVASELLALAAT